MLLYIKKLCTRIHTNFRLTDNAKNQPRVHQVLITDNNYKFYGRPRSNLNQRKAPSKRNCNRLGAALPVSQKQNCLKLRHEHT